MKPETSLKNRLALANRREAIRRYIRSTMVLKNLQYKDLRTLLEAHGVSISEENLRNKVGSGKFAGDLLTLIFHVLELNDHALTEIEKLLPKEEN